MTAKEHADNMKPPFRGLPAGGKMNRTLSVSASKTTVNALAVAGGTLHLQAMPHWRLILAINRPGLNKASQHDISGLSSKAFWFTLMKSHTVGAARYAGGQTLPGMLGEIIERRAGRTLSRVPFASRR
jgi:hypothetical protein